MKKIKFAFLLLIITFTCFTNYAKQDNKITNNSTIKMVSQESKEGMFETREGEYKCLCKHTPWYCTPCDDNIKEREELLER